MGKADTTTTVGNGGIHIFNDYYNNNFKPFIEDTNEKYEEEDKIKSLLTIYSNWISTPPCQSFNMKNFRVTSISISIQPT